MERFRWSHGVSDRKSPLADLRDAAALRCGAATLPKFNMTSDSAGRGACRVAFEVTPGRSREASKADLWARQQLVLPALSRPRTDPASGERVRETERIRRGGRRFGMRHSAPRPGRVTNLVTRMRKGLPEDLRNAVSPGIAGRIRSYDLWVMSWA